jgi:hypothetical protein
MKKLTSDSVKEFTGNFHLKFLNEFLISNINISSPNEVQQEHYCRIILDSTEFKDYLNENMISTFNNPFAYKICKRPDAQINEKFVLIYEEVFIIFNNGNKIEKSK